MSKLADGDIAPEIDLPRDGGDRVRLADLRGQPVVVFFYPKDNTPGCTTEARDFTARAGDFADLGVAILGISKDSVKKHENFVAKQGLGIPLLSDAEGDVCERYGVWGEKKMYGKTFEGITRTTVLIDAEGRVCRIWPKVKVAGHVDEVLDAARELVGP